MKIVVNGFAPQVRPRFWVVAETACCAYSVFLLLLNVFGTDDSKGKQFAKESYLVYSLITCSIWFFCVGLAAAYNFDFGSWEQRIELMLAVVFTGNAVAELVEWRWKDQNIGFMNADILLNIVAYLYESGKSFLLILKRPSDYEPIETKSENGNVSV